MTDGSKTTMASTAAIEAPEITDESTSSSVESKSSNKSPSSTSTTTGTAAPTSTTTESPPPNMYTDLDVVSGRDVLAKHHPGNWVFKSLVKKNRPTYRSLESNIHKAMLAESIMSTIQKAGGRFMKRKEESSVWNRQKMQQKSTEDSGDDVDKKKTDSSNDNKKKRKTKKFDSDDDTPCEWVELTYKEALAKTTQALRENFGKKFPPLRKSIDYHEKHLLVPSGGKSMSESLSSSSSSSSSTGSTSPETVPTTMMPSTAAASAAMRMYNLHHFKAQHTAAAAAAAAAAGGGHPGMNMFAHGLPGRPTPTGAMWPAIGHPAAATTMGRAIGGVGIPTMNNQFVRGPAGSAGTVPSMANASSSLIEIELMMLQQRKMALGGDAAGLSRMPMLPQPNVSGVGHVSGVGAEKLSLLAEREKMILLSQQQQQQRRAQQILALKDKVSSMATVPPPLPSKEAVTEKKTSAVRTHTGQLDDDEVLRQYVSKLSREQLQALIHQK